MNEQIQKLAELAGFNLHNDLIDGHNLHHGIEKFAQLIVFMKAKICWLLILRVVLIVEFVFQNVRQRLYLLNLLI